jgi:hypothetical protein
MGETAQRGPAVKVSNRIPLYAATALLVLLVAGYLLQLATPLRLNTDAYRLLSMAVSAAEGRGFLVDGRPDQYPLGYPLMVLGLLKAGLASSAALVFINLAALAVGLFCVWQIVAALGFDFRQRLVVVLATLLSWVVIKHVTLPLSDLPYLGVSLASLACLQAFWTARGPKKWSWFSAGVLLAIAATLIRTVGFTLAPAFALSLVLHEDHRALLRQPGRQGLIRSLMISTLLLALFGSVVLLFRAQVVHKGSYLGMFLGALKRNSIATLAVSNIRHSLLDFGELFVNLPVTKAPQLIGLLVLAGLVAWAAVCFGCWLARKHLLPTILYFVSYSAVMVCWPHVGSRFWLPMIPLLAVFTLEVVRFLQEDRRALRWAFGAYFAFFLALGAVALGYSTRISLSGQEFSEMYGDGTTRMTYRYALDNGRPVDMSEVDAGKVRLLAIFEPRVPERIKRSPQLDPALPATP